MEELYAESGMPEMATDHKQLRQELHESDIEVSDGGVSGHLRTEHALNLNALAIGLGLERVIYEPERLPGLVYSPDEFDTTVVLFDDGDIAVVDAPDESTARETLVTVLETMEDVDLFDGEIARNQITTSTSQ